jgi:hypothetical protein
MAGSVIQGCFPHGLQVVQRQQAATPPAWVHERTAVGGRVAASSVQAKAIAPRVTHEGTATPLPPQLAPFPAAGGQPIEPAVRQRMEAAFGQSFADVRVHVGPHAAQIGAVAFTQGSQIHFAPGKYDPVTPQGRHVLAHELAHVVQQRAGRVQNPFGSGVAVVQNPLLEAEAERMARRAAMQPVAQPPRVAGRTATPAAQPMMRNRSTTMPPRATKRVAPPVMQTIQPMMRGRGVVQRTWIADHHGTLGLKQWQQQQNDVENRQDGWYSTDQSGAPVHGPLDANGRLPQLSAYCTNRINALPQFNVQTEVNSYGQGPGAQQAIVQASAEQGTTRASIAIFHYLDQHAATIDQVMTHCFLALGVDDIAAKSSVLGTIGGLIQEKTDRNLFAGADDRTNIILGMTTMTAFLRNGKALLGQKAPLVRPFALAAFLRKWSLGLEVKSYSRRVESLELADTNVVMSGEQIQIGQNDEYEFVDSDDFPVAWADLEVGQTYKPFKVGGMNNYEARLDVVNVGSVTMTVLRVAM